MAEESNVLFVRGNGNKSDEEDVWDDSALIQAYDRAVNLAKEEVAKRIAMDTQDRQIKQKPKNSNYSSHTKKPFKKWIVGAPCRAVYPADGQLYEAIVSHVDPNSGYQNIETVQVNSLLESEGLQSQIAQQKNALKGKVDERVDSDTPIYIPSVQDSKQMNGERMDYDTEDPRSFKKNFMPGFERFNPAIDTMPPAPPLPPLMAKLPETDADALSSMLMSWYISGFHTGYYHGLKQAKINQQKRKNYQ
ncbi:PREDICTED: survival motor neuron protein isoform X2 [Vollenhovia emeryi]|uniref:survival motor neuron protein isoform X2 n=1 Tax=Vollenhovia emeryi TaxID=411798 RepID=UPI0005F56949|nr:PREDICTED: survival motor neuron protein isoform X2 [Vollenhovia emeryi]